MRLRYERGQAMAEFALMIPILILLLFGTHKIATPGSISLPQVNSGTIILPKKYWTLAFKMCFPATVFPSKGTRGIAEPCHIELIG